MQITITSDRQLTEGLLIPITEWRLPHRLVTATYRPESGSADFASATPAYFASIYNSLFRALGLNTIDPRYDWVELKMNGARYLVERHVQIAPAYDIELRDMAGTKHAADIFFENTSNARFFSSYDVVEQNGTIINYNCPGSQLTNHTFEFAIVAIQHGSIVLFYTCDED